MLLRVLQRSFSFQNEFASGISITDTQSNVPSPNIHTLVELPRVLSLFHAFPHWISRLHLCANPRAARKGQRRESYLRWEIASHQEVFSAAGLFSWPSGLWGKASTVSAADRVFPFRKSTVNFDMAYMQLFFFFFWPRVW